jgi:hypothetical protein
MQVLLDSDIELNWDEQDDKWLQMSSFSVQKFSAVLRKLFLLFSPKNEEVFLKCQNRKSSMNITRLVLLVVMVISLLSPVEVMFYYANIFVDKVNLGASFLFGFLSGLVALLLLGISFFCVEYFIKHRESLLLLCCFLFNLSGCFSESYFISDGEVMYLCVAYFMGWVRFHLAVLYPNRSSLIIF